MIHKFFLAIRPDAGATARIVTERDRQRALHGLDGPIAPPDHFHVSLYGLGAWEDAPASFLDGVKAALEAVEMPPFDIEFTYALSLGRGDGRHAFVLSGDQGVDGVHFLRRELETLVPRHLPGLRRPPPLSLPHLTLLRDRQMVPEQAIEPIRWTARDLVLIDSLHGRGRHIRVGGRRLGSTGEPG